VGDLNWADRHGICRLVDLQCHGGRFSLCKLLSLHICRSPRCWPDLILMKPFCLDKTQFPVILSMVIVALWAWVNIEIQRMQPYIDLVRGNAPAERSLLLDYTRLKCVDLLHLLTSCVDVYPFSSKFFVWISAFSNHHYMVATVTLVALFALVLEPLCASIFIVKDTWWGPDRQFPGLRLISQWNEY
jgi:Protein of unknown function (DUF3433)